MNPANRALAARSRQADRALAARSKQADRALAARSRLYIYIYITYIHFDTATNSWNYTLFLWYKKLLSQFKNLEKAKKKAKFK